MAYNGGHGNEYGGSGHQLQDMPAGSTVSHEAALCHKYHDNVLI